MKDRCPTHSSRLIDLVHGLLPEAETREMIEHIRRCPDCDAQMRRLVAERESLRAGPVPAMIDGRIQLGRPRARRFDRRWLVVAAAVVAIAAFGIVRTLERDGPVEYWIPIGGESTVLRSPGIAAQRPAMGDALQSYEARDASAAAGKLKALTIPPGDEAASAFRDLYLASALVNAGRPDEAIEILDLLVDVDAMPAEWRFHARWVRYLALRRAGEGEKARAWLETLAREGGEIGEKARAELNR